MQGLILLVHKFGAPPQVRLRPPLGGDGHDNAFIDLRASHLMRTATVIKLCSITSSADNDDDNEKNVGSRRHDGGNEKNVFYLNVISTTSGAENDVRTSSTT